MDLICLARNWRSSKFIALLAEVKSYCQLVIYILFEYRNDPKFLDRYAWANSADPDQRGAVWSGSTLFAIPSASLGLITLW